jgi:lipoyl(octanoyl) transferase
LLEHAPVITLGRNAKAANVLVSTEQLAARGVEVFECDRGGDVTFHGLGQMVGYPIFDLRRHELLPLDGGLRSRIFTGGGARATQARKTLGAVDYVRRLEEVVIRTCADFGIATKRVPGLTGVWTDAVGDGGQPRAAVRPQEGKIAAIGVHISRSVTSHGFALNVNTDLSYFNLIVPCGIAAKPVTSMQKELGREIEMEDVGQSLARNFGIVFRRRMERLGSVDELVGPATGVPARAPADLRRVRGEEDLFLA